MSFSLKRLSDNAITDLRDALRRVCNGSKCAVAQVKHAPRNERPPVRAFSDHGLARSWICDFHLDAKWEIARSKREAVGIKATAISSSAAMKVIAVPIVRGVAAS